MTRDEFLEHIRLGYPATEAVRKATGFNPVIETIAETDLPDAYIRRGVMMVGPYMAALVALALSPHLLTPRQLDRIRSGEPTGQVLTGLRRIGTADLHGTSITSTAMLLYCAAPVGFASEVFTSTLLEFLDG